MKNLASTYQVRPVDRNCDFELKNGSGCYLEGLIAGAGFEPATSGLWARRATGLLYPAITQIYIPQKMNCSRPIKANYKFSRIWAAIASILPC